MNRVTMKEPFEIVCEHCAKASTFDWRYLEDRIDPYLFFDCAFCGKENVISMASLRAKRHASR